MTIKEMQIAFDSGVQYLFANKARGIQPEERDLILNKMIERYILSRLRPKEDGTFEIDLVAQQQLSTLLKRMPIPSIIGSSNTYQVNIPGECGWLIAAGAETRDISCLTTIPADSSYTLYKHKLTYPQSNLTTPKFYVVAALAGKTMLGITSANAVPNWAGVARNEQWFEVLNQLVHACRKDGINIRRSGREITISSATVSTPYTAQADGTTVTATVTTEQHRVYQAIDTRMNPIRFSPSATFFQLSGTPFWKTTYLSPIAYIEDDTVKIVGDSSFIVSTCTLIYVKKPAIVSLSLGVNCDLPEGVHSEIVDLAISYAKTELNSPDWEKKLADLKLNTTV